ncbi:MAG: LTA synthase family protein [Bacteroidota bacterium]
MNTSQKKALLSIMVMALVFQVQRLLFLLFNLDSFEGLGISDFLMAFIYGIRFDLSAIIMINALYLFALLVPINLQERAGFQKGLDVLFLIINIPAIILNSIDLEYFKFQGKRTTADLFDLFVLGDDVKNTLPQMAKDFWPVLLVSLILSVVIILIQRKKLVVKSKSRGQYKLSNWLLTSIALPLAFLGARGSWDLKPLRIANAASTGHPGAAPIILNTPFTIIKTIGVPTMELRFEMDEQDAIRYFSREKTNLTTEQFKKMNVVVIILESFSAEYSSLLSGKKGYTPFLDSMMQQGLYFNHAYANAKKSIDGIPAVTSSIPALMPVSYITSPFSANRITSIAGLLADKEYASAFFHGGNNGTMGFDNFSRISGHNKYFGRSEYGKEDYDGNWGVFDEPFYEFFVEEVSKMKEPFTATFFSLSSHHPYSIPEKLKDRFPKGQLPIHESIGYADYALRAFFEAAAELPWYDNTLFVLTADHTGPAESPEYSTRNGVFKIPLVFYRPDGSLKGVSNKTVQQADILPSVLDYLGYDESWSDFGTSVFDSSSTGIAVNSTGDLYQITRNDTLLQFDGMKSVGLYSLKSDPLMEDNLIEQSNTGKIELELIIKSYLIQYQNAMRNNTLAPLR